MLGYLKDVINRVVQTRGGEKCRWWILKLEPFIDQLGEKFLYGYFE
jgi:hypothetical protein